MPLNNENNNECCKCTTPEYELILNEQGPQGRQGEKGNDGFSPSITVTEDNYTTYKLKIQTKDGIINTPNLKSTLPAGGNQGQFLMKASSVDGQTVWSDVQEATTEQAGIVQLATENDLEPDSEGEVDDTKAVTPNLLSTYVEQEINNADDKYVTLDTEQQITGKKTFSFNDGIFANSIKEINQGSTIITYNQDASNILIGSTGANTSNITLRTKQDGQLLYQKGANNSLQIITSEDIATTSKAGIVKPDGTTITIDTDGTLHGASTYSLPTASATTLGGIKVGDNLTIDDNGVLSSVAEPYTLPQATATALGGIKANEKDDTDTQEVKIDPATGILYTQPGGGNITSIDGGNAQTNGVVAYQNTTFYADSAIVNNGLVGQDTVTIQDGEV